MGHFMKTKYGHVALAWLLTAGCPAAGGGSTGSPARAAAAPAAIQEAATPAAGGGAPAGSGGRRGRRRRAAPAAGRHRPAVARRHRRQRRQRRWPAPAAAAWRARAPAGAGGWRRAAAAPAVRRAAPLERAAARRVAAAGRQRRRRGAARRREQRALHLPGGPVHGAEPVEHHADEGRRRAAVRRVQQQRQQLRKHRGRGLVRRRPLRLRDRRRQQPAARAHPARHDRRAPSRSRYATSGTNGLAIDMMGRLIGASHTAGGVVAFNLTTMTSTPIVSDVHGQSLQHAQRPHRAQRRDDLLHRSRLPGAQPAPAGA